MKRGDELVRIPLTTTDVGDRTQCGEISVVDVEDAIPILRRLIVATELVARDAGAARDDVHAFVVVRRDVDLALEDVHELGPRLPRLVEVRHRGESLGVLT